MRLGACLRRAAIVLVGGLLLAGCGSAVYSVIQQRAYNPAELRYAAQDKDLLTVIHGNPFETGDAAFREAVLAAMQPSNWGFDVAFTPRTRLTDQPGESARTEYFVAVAFGADAEHAAALCGEAPDLTGAAEGTGDVLDARMVFCREGQLLSTTRGALDGVSSPADARFAMLIARMTRELFPQRNYLDDGGPASGQSF